MFQQVLAYVSAPRLTNFFKDHPRYRLPVLFLIPLFGVATALSARPSNIEVFPGDTTIAATICANETYLFDGQLLDLEGEYSATYVASDGSDSIVTLQLTVLPLLTENITASICAGETYSFFGQSLDTSGDYEEVLMGSNGCDSTVTLQLTVLPLLTESITVSICAGESYPFFGLALNTSGDYDGVITGSNGCDSTITLHLTVLAPIVTNLNAGICSGTAYLFNGDTLTESGIYLATLIAENGCDSLVRLKLNVVEYFDVQQAATICNGETYEFGGIIFDNSGVYVDSLTAIGGCDSVVTLTLTILPPLSSHLDISICEGSNYVFHGETLNTAGLYVYPETGSFGCDSLVVLNLETVTSFETTLEATICDGETYTLGTQELTTSGVYNEFLTAIGGCDSTLTLTLTVLPTSSGVDSVTVCDGQTYTYHGDILSNPGDYEYILESVNGCDSVVTFTLTVLEAPNTVLEAVICAGTTYFFYGQELNEEGVYEQIFEAANGCDSTVSLILTVLPELVTNVEATICASDTYDFNGDVLDSSGVYTRVLLSEFGCDSTVTLTLTVLPEHNTTTDIAVCAGESYEFDGSLLTESGTYTAVLADASGCDSTVTLHLEVLPLQQSNIEASICEGTTYPFNGALLTTEGVYTSVLTGSFGCDSTVTLTLTVLPTHETVIDATICEGSGYNYFGQLLTEAGSYEFGLLGENGCDSIIVINITVLPLQYGSIDVEICAGESYDYNGTSLFVTGVFEFVHPGANGCDSIFIVYLTVHPVTTTTLNVVACEGSTYDFNGISLVTSGSYIADYTSIYGCDSSVVLNLTFVNFYESALEAAICAGESYTFGTDALTESGVYTQTLTAAGGCDSTVTLTLIVLPESQSETNAVICAGTFFPFNGTLLTDSGTYTAVLTAANGCDSTVVLNLNVLPVVSTSTEAEICSNGSYDFNGATLNEAGVYTGVFNAANGCDSIVTLTLTVLPALTSSIEATICASETYQFNGAVLTQSGSYTATYAAANGCDSLVTLVLTVLPLPQGAFAAVVCGGQPYEFNGETLTESGVYDFILENAAANGCDSVVTLFLSIFPNIPPTILDASICAGSSYEINGQSLTVGGQYTFNFASSTGCDSIVVLHLTVLPASATVINLVGCAGQGGIFVTTLVNQYGCDSIITTIVVEDVVNVSVALNNGVLTATSSPNTTLQWIDCANNQPIPGATGNSYTPTVTGQYAVVATNGIGCTAVSDCISVVVVGTQEPLLAASEWALMPNPAQGNTSILLKEAFTSDIWLEIMDGAGRLLHRQTILSGANQVDLDISAFPDGILLVRLMGSEGTSAKLLMKGH